MFKRIIYKVLFISALACSIMACQKESNMYTIKGKLANVEDSVFLSVREMEDSLVIDTIKINNKGEFSYSGTADTLTVVSLYFKGVAASPYVLVDKGWNVEIEGDIRYPDLILVKGGEVNEELTKFKTENKGLLLDRAKLANEMLDADSTNTKDYLVGFKNVNFELQNLAADYIKKNPTKISSVILIDSFFKSEETLGRLTEGLEQLTGTAEDFPLAIRLREYRDKVKKSAVGSYAPTFVMEDINGKSVSMMDYRRKYVFLSFLSADIEMLKNIIPNLTVEYDKAKKEEKDFELILVIKDTEKGKINEIRKLIKRDWIIIPEYKDWSAEIFENYNIHEIPYNILISKEGKILERNIPIYGLDNKLKDYTKLSTRK